MAFLKSQRDEPNTQREYETIYIVRPDANTEQIQQVNDRVLRVIEKDGGKVIRLDNWGKRKLAYEIKKQLKGIYLYWLYLGDAELVAEIERNLRMLDLVIRHFTVAVDEDVDPEARPSEMDEEAFAAAATVVPDEEDAYMGRTAEEDEEGEAKEGEGEAKAGEAKQDEAKEDEAKAGEAKQDEAKQGEAKEDEAKEGEAKEGEGEAKKDEAKSDDKGNPEG